MIEQPKRRGRPPGAPNKTKRVATKVYGVRLTEAQHAYAKAQSGCGSAAAWIRLVIDQTMLVRDMERLGY